jgi:hypothetical protein
VGNLIKNKKVVGIVRLRMNPSAKPKDYPFLLECHVSTAQSVPRKEAFDQYGAAEDKAEEIEKEGDIVLMACQTGQGERRWFYYAKKLSTGSHLLNAFKIINAKIDASPDPEWNGYNMFLEVMPKNDRQ